MMGSLSMIGIGLYTVDDISIRALRLLHKADIVYMESYTSYMPQTIQSMNETLGVRVIPLGRKEIEQDDIIIKDAKERNVAFLVVGDPLQATTHMELILRAKNERIRTTIINNTSVISAASRTGLESYKFGKTGSIVYPRKNWFPKTYYSLLIDNLRIKAHTLLLLDIVTTKSEIEMLDFSKGNIADANKMYNPSSGITSLDLKPMVMMSPNEAIELLLEAEKEEGKGIISNEARVFVCSRLCHPDEKIVYGSIKSIKTMQYGIGPHCIIIPSDLHFIEEEFANNHSSGK
jgi:diphthine synthase